MYRLISLNINGLNDHLKRTALIDWLKCMKVDIVCLQETHAASHSTIQRWFRHSNFTVASSSISSKRCWTAVLIRDIFKLCEVRKDADGRFVQVEVELDGNKLRFVSLYAPKCWTRIGGVIHRMPALQSAGIVARALLPCSPCWPQLKNFRCGVRAIHQWQCSPGIMPLDSSPPGST